MWYQCPTSSYGGPLRWRNGSNSSHRFPATQCVPVGISIVSINKMPAIFCLLDTFERRTRDSKIGGKKSGNIAECKWTHASLKQVMLYCGLRYICGFSSYGYPPSIPFHAANRLYCERHALTEPFWLYSRYWRHQELSFWHAYVICLFSNHILWMHWGFSFSGFFFIKSETWNSISLVKCIYILHAQLLVVILATYLKQITNDSGINWFATFVYAWSTSDRFNGEGIRSTVSIHLKDTTSRADSSLAPSQWETTLLCNDISHLLGENIERALICITPSISRGAGYVFLHVFACLVYMYTYIYNAFIH